MVAGGSGPAGIANSIGAAGTAVTAASNRLITSQSGLPLAKFINNRQWQAQVGDFIIWHGWWKRWYGVVNGVDRDHVYVIKENLPILLFTMAPEDHLKNTMKISINKIVNAPPGEFHILQGDHWYVP